MGGQRQLFMQLNYCLFETSSVKEFVISPPRSSTAALWRLWSIQTSAVVETEATQVGKEGQSLSFGKMTRESFSC